MECLCDVATQIALKRILFSITGSPDIKAEAEAEASKPHTSYELPDWQKCRDTISNLAPCPEGAQYLVVEPGYVFSPSLKDSLILMVLRFECQRCNAIQLVDFAARLLKKGSEIRFHGDTVDNAKLEAVTIDLVQLSRNISSSIGGGGVSGMLRGKEEQALVDTAENCTLAANELINCLRNLKRKSRKNIVWASFRQAVKTEWSKEDVKTMATRLDTYRSDLTLRTLFFLNTKVAKQIDYQEQHFNQLERKSNEIIEAILVSQKTNAHESDTHHPFHKQSREKFQDAIAAIFTHRDGLTTTISSPLASTFQSGGPMNPNSWTKEVMTLQNRTLPGQSQGDGRASFTNFAALQRRVLQGLSFKKIRDRMDEVAPAHKATFRWIFEDLKPPQRPWANFLGWLQKGRECYWINGKAGSGKSTLMKYIHDSPHTRDALEQWAGRTRLILASFFSWNMGSALQKTQVGLLRSLLHDILEQVPDLIPTILPRLSRAASLGEDVQPTLPELKSAFEKLSCQTVIPLKVCLLIDGIDEFDGGHAEISEFMFSTASSDFRIILSSRPIPECVDVFGERPSLRLQDLTYGDIRSYTDERIRSHRRWRELLEEEGPQALQLLEDIVGKADGVFLWVILVVASLLEGLRNYDRVSDLRRRLDALPPDLENLYSHMLNKLQPLYRRQGSQLLQIVKQHIEIEADQPLNPLQISFADEEDTEYALRDDLQPLSTKQRLARSRAVEGRIRSRCCGLVEIWQDWSEVDVTTRILNSRVSFLHRTVAEFLRSSHISKEMVLHMVGKDFDPNVSLAKCFLSDIKTSNDMRSMDFIQSDAWNSMRRCLNRCRFSTPATAQRLIQIIDELDRTMCRRWKSIDRWHGGFTDGDHTVFIVTQKFDWSLSELRQTYRLGNFGEFSDLQASMLVLAATMGLTEYIGFKCGAHEFKIDPSQLQQAMLAAVYSASRRVEDGSHAQSHRYSDVLSIERAGSVESYLAILECLLQARASPDRPVGRKGCTPWMLALQETEKMAFSSETPAWGDILHLFASSNANPNESAIEKTRQLTRYRSALGVVMTKIKDCCRADIPPHLRSNANQFRDRLIEIQELLKARGAQRRDWAEIPENIRPERQETPAPWAEESGRLNGIFNPSARRVSPDRHYGRNRRFEHISESTPKPEDAVSGSIQMRGRRRGRRPRPGQSDDKSDSGSTSSDEGNPARLTTATTSLQESLQAFDFSSRHSAASSAEVNAGAQQISIRPSGYFGRRLRSWFGLGSR